MADPRERVFPAQPFDAGGVKAFASPVQFLLTGEDNLRVTWISAADVTLHIQGRMLIASSHAVQAFDYRIEQVADYQSHSRVFALTEGVLLNLVATTEQLLVTPGILHVRVDIIRGLEGATQLLGTLLAGYVGSYGGRAWPGTPLETPLDGPGALKSYTSADPAAGANASLQQQVRTRWRLISARTVIVTDATAGSRFCALITLPRSSGQFTYPVFTAVPPSTGRTLVWNAGAAYPDSPHFASSGPLSVDLVLDSLTPGDSLIQTSVSGLAAGDDISALQVYVEEWLNPTNPNPF